MESVRAQIFLFHNDAKVDADDSGDDVEPFEINQFWVTSLIWLNWSAIFGQIFSPFFRCRVYNRTYEICRISGDIEKEESFGSEIPEQLTPTLLTDPVHPEAKFIIPYFSKEHIDPETPYPPTDNLINCVDTVIDSAHANHGDGQQPQE